MFTLWHSYCESLEESSPTSGQKNIIPLVRCVSASAVSLGCAVQATGTSNVIVPRCTNPRGMHSVNSNWRIYAGQRVGYCTRNGFEFTGLTPCYTQQGGSRLLKKGIILLLNGHDLPEIMFMTVHEVSQSETTCQACEECMPVSGQTLNRSRIIIKIPASQV